MDINQKGYERLVIAVVAQAAKDHCKSFFFEENNIFLKKLDGPTLWNQIEKNFAEHGKWYAKDANNSQEFYNREYDQEEGDTLYAKKRIKRRERRRKQNA